MGQRLAILSPEFIRNSDKFMGSYITDFKFLAGRIWHVKVAPMYEFCHVMVTWIMDTRML